MYYTYITLITVLSLDAVLQLLCRWKHVSVSLWCTSAQLLKSIHKSV